MSEVEITEDFINQSSGRELFSTILRLKHSTDSNRGALLKACFRRAKDLNKNRYGDWEQAKVEINHMPTPQYFENKELLPVFGYPCEFIYSKNGNFISIINPKLNCVYTTGTGQVTEKQARSIFNS